jgi:hypothetical protein
LNRAQTYSIGGVENQMNAYIREANSRLASNDFPIPAIPGWDNPAPGLLAFSTSKSGGYIESLGYMNMVMSMSTPFFTALARTSDTEDTYYNYYNDPSIAAWVQSAIDRTTPYLGDWAYNDTNYLGYGAVKNLEGTSETNINTFMAGITDFYYYSDDPQYDELRAKCVDYINCKIIHISIFSYYPGTLQFEFKSFFV